MQDKILISVIIPNYNRSEKLQKAIQSVLAQSFPVLEVLVCDDGSTDNSRQVVQGFNLSNVRWIECGRNGRPAIPRNKGVLEAKGNWLAFLDNDDEWLPLKLQKQVEEIGRRSAKAVCSNAFRSINGNVQGSYASIINDRCFGFNDLVMSNSVICSSVLVSADLVRSAGAFPEKQELKALEDYALWLRIACATDFYYLGECLLNYNDESSTSIRSQSLSTEEQRRIIFKDFKKWRKKNKQSCSRQQLMFIEQEFVLRFLEGSRLFWYKLGSII